MEFMIKFIFWFVVAHMFFRIAMAIYETCRDRSKKENAVMDFLHHYQDLGEL